MLLVWGVGCGCVLLLLDEDVGWCFVDDCVWDEVGVVVGDVVVVFVDVYVIGLVVYDLVVN